MAERKLTQRTFDFDAPAAVESTPAAPAASSDLSEETMPAIDRLADWLTDPRTAKPVTELGEETLLAVRKALVEGKNGYVQSAEDLLGALVSRNGPTSGDDVAPGPVAEGDDFQATIEDLLDALASV
jgi:hypothetical protein